MRDFISGFGHGVLGLFEMTFSLLCIGDVMQSEFKKSGKPAKGRVYIPDPDYQPPEEELPTITREEN